MVRNVVSFILSIFEFSRWVYSMEQSKLVHFPKYLVSNGRQVLLVRVLAQAVLPHYDNY